LIYLNNFINFERKNMGHSKPTQVSKTYLETAPLPNHGKTYTVVSHKEVMDHTKKLLDQHNLKITKSVFRSNLNANVAQGIYHINTNSSDSELGMMFAWTNSYDKSTRFQCGIGAYVFVCNNGMIKGDMANYGRKHTGTANADIALTIARQLGQAKHSYTQLIQDKDEMKNVSLSTKEQAEFAGRLFIDEKLIDSQQLSIVKSEMSDPSYNYGVDPDTAWMFYNHVTHAFKVNHPRTWMEKQSKFHEFMVAELLSNSQLKNRDQVKEPEEDIDIPQEIELDESTFDQAANIFDL
tara:strand:+ start:2597 stop:3478 length:882 start_codon:yes stop_codon:yes gene_type:complete